MNNISKEIKNDDGTIETLVITSNDNHNLDMSQTYKLANHKSKKESALVKKFKGSILGADIGIKSGGFSNVAILATIIAVGALCVMYFLWRF